MLILRDVLRWRAEEVATLLDTSIASVKSALARARTTLGSRPETLTAPVDRELLDRYVDAFGRYDVDALVALLHEDATLAMPPYDLWLHGREEIRTWLLTRAAECRGSALAPIAVNGSLGFTQHRPTGRRGVFEPFAVTVLESRGRTIAAIHAFIDPALVTRFSSAA